MAENLDAFWLRPQVEALQRARAQRRLPPSLLIHDVAGGGGELLAETAVQIALCSGGQPPCGQCRSCQLLASGRHPDRYFVGLVDESKQIRVEQVRELIDMLGMTSHQAQGAGAIIHPADALNASAANALLKTLEEPRPGVTIVLVTSLPSRLPATIRSRCQRLQVRLPPRAELVRWLQQLRGAGDWHAVLEVLCDAPFRAAAVDAAALLQLRGDTFQALTEAAAGSLDIPATAARWARSDDLELRLACVENWITGRIASGIDGAAGKSELRTGPHLQVAALAMNIASLIRLYDAVRELVRLLTTPMNKSLAVEQLLWQLRTGANP